jgi:hypothetical protein
MQMCSALQITRRDTLSSFPLRRQGDVLLMQAISDSIPDKNVLFRVNKCRIYLQVVTLADIYTCDGLRITQDAWDCKSNNTCSTAVSWPAQGPLPLNYREEWRNTLKRVFGIRRATMLPTLLGPYFATDTSICTYYSPELNGSSKNKQINGLCTGTYPVLAPSGRLSTSNPAPPRISPLIQSAHQSLGSPKSD